MVIDIETEIEATANVDASTLSDVLCVTRYTSKSCGAEPSKDGRLLLLDDVVKALKFVTDDDSCIHGRLRDLMESLESEPMVEPEKPVQKCECHERDSSYVCDYCYSQGLRGHMQE